MMSQRFAVRWDWNHPGGGPYVTKRQPNHKPYASDIHDPDVKTWATEANAQRWLDVRCPYWGANCVIVPIPSDPTTTEAK